MARTKEAVRGNVRLNHVVRPLPTPLVPLGREAPTPTPRRRSPPDEGRGPPVELLQHPPVPGAAAIGARTALADGRPVAALAAGGIAVAGGLAGTGQRGQEALEKAHRRPPSAAITDEAVDALPCGCHAVASLAGRWRTWGVGRGRERVKG